METAGYVIAAKIGEKMEYLCIDRESGGYPYWGRFQSAKYYASVESAARVITESSDFTYEPVAVDGTTYPPFMIQKSKAMIYLASPYSHRDKDVQNLRAEQVSKMAAKLMREGYHIFSPVAHGVQLAQHGLPHGYEEFWKPYCIDMLKRCDRLVVLLLRDWHLSVGVMDEISYAVKNDIPVSFVGLWNTDLKSLKTI